MSFFSISLILIIINFIVSYRGFKDPIFFDKFSFKLDAVKFQKDYKRLVTSGFVHVNWQHLIFNMLSLYFFSGSIEGALGSFYFILIYATGLVAGNLLSLFIHRFDTGYSSCGASGAIAAVIFSAIALFPGLDIALLFIPIPAWLFGLAYVLISIYGIRSRQSNIGHDAHLGGGMAGMLLTVLLFPRVLVDNTFSVLVVAVPALTFLLFIIYKPEALLINNFFTKRKAALTAEDKYNLSRKNQEKELDRLLEKIHVKGMNSLTAKEKENLRLYSQKNNP